MRRSVIEGTASTLQLVVLWGVIRGLRLFRVAHGGVAVVADDGGENGAVW